MVLHSFNYRVQSTEYRVFKYPFLQIRFQRKTNTRQLRFNFSLQLYFKKEIILYLSVLHNKTNSKHFTL